MRIFRRTSAFIASIALVATALVVTIAWQIRPEAQGATCTNGSLTPLQVGIDASQEIKSTLSAHPLCVGPISYATAPVHNNENGQNYAFQKAVWVGADVRTLTGNTTFLFDGSADHIVEIKELAKNGDTLTIIPADADQSDSRIILSTTIADAEKHLVLVYGSAAATALVEYTVAGADIPNGDILMTGQAYDKSTHRQLFAWDSTKNSFVQQVRVSTPRQYETQVTTPTTTQTLSTVSTDESSPERTVQTLNVEVPSTMASDAVATNGGIVKVNLTVVKKEAGQMTAVIPENNVNWGASSNIPNYGYYSVRYNLIAYGGCKSSGNCDAPTELRSSASNTNDYSVKKPVARTWPSNKQPTGISTTYGGTTYAEVDALPDMSNRSDSPNSSTKTGGIEGGYSAFLAGVIINGQRFNVPMSQPCVAPADIPAHIVANNDETSPNIGVAGIDDVAQTKGQIVTWCGETGKAMWGAGDWSEKMQKKRYTCVRAWLLGIRNVTYGKNSNTACGLHYIDEGTSNPASPINSVVPDSDLPGSPSHGGGVLLDQDVESGPLAGSHLKVTLINARSMYDSYYSLDTMSTYADNLDPVYGGSYVYYWWRTRVKVEVSNLTVPNLTVKLGYQWNKDWQMKFGEGDGVDGLSQFNGAAATDDFGSSFQLWGHNDSNWSTTNPKPAAQWINICRNDHPDPNNTRGINSTACGWARGGQELDDANADSRMAKIRFKVINGYQNPTVTALATPTGSDLADYSSTKTTADGYVKFTLPSYPSYETTVAGKSTVNFWSNGSYLINAGAELMHIPLKYYNDTGGLLSTYPVVSTDVLSTAVTTLSTKVPTSIGGFVGWELHGVGLNGLDEKLESKLLLPGGLVDIRKYHLSTSTGEPRITEFKLVAKKSGVSDLSGPGLYSVAKKWGDLTNPANQELAFSFYGGPGMTAKLASSWVNAPENETLVRENILYRLAENQSRLSQVLLSDIAPAPASPSSGDTTTRIALAANDSSEVSDVTVPLYLAYVTSQTGTFTKTLICDEPTDTTGWTEPAACDPLTSANQLPDRQDFRLKLTPTGESSTGDSTESSTGSGVIYLEHGAGPVALPSGSYTLSEEIKGAVNQWSPSTVWAPTSGYSCTSNGTELVDNGVLTVTDSTGAVACSATNGAAALTLRAWDPTGSGSWRPDTTLGLASSGSAAISWTSSDQEAASTWAVAAATRVTVSATAPTGYTVIGFQQLTGTTWGAVAGEGNTSVPAAFVHSAVSTGTPAITLASGALGQIRAVVVPTEKIATVRFTAAEMTGDIRVGPAWADATAASFGLKLSHSEAGDAGTGTGTFETVISHGRTNQEAANPAGVAILERGLTYTCQIVANPATVSDTSLSDVWGLAALTGTGVTVADGSCTVGSDGGEQAVAATFGKAAATVKVVDAADNPLSTDSLTVTAGQATLIPGAAPTLVTPGVAHELAVNGVPLGWHVSSLTPKSPLTATPGTFTEITVTLDRPSFALPFTGGRPADYFLIGGVLVAMAGAAWAAWTNGARRQRVDVNRA